MVFLIYHEKQESALCGVHCLNNLLQGSYFNASDLAEIALNIDANEKKLMEEAGHTSSDFLKFMAEDSGNVADTGFFSVQVLGSALENAFNLKLIPSQSSEGKLAMENPIDEIGFICNLEEHWMCVRKIDGNWYNLNSLLKHPSPLSQFYLSAFLDTLSKEGYSIFIVRGIFPNIVEQWGQPNWVPVPEHRSSKTQYQEDTDLQKAISESLGGTTNNFVDLTNDNNDEDLLKAIEQSLQDSKRNTDNNDEDDLQAALLLSQQTFSGQNQN